MKRRVYTLAGWGLGLFAAGALSVAFPAIAEKAADHRADAQWAELAADYKEAQSKNHVDADSYAFAEWMSEPTFVLNDKAATQTFLRVKPQITTIAKQDMSEHQCLSEAVYYEARSETRSGQMGVAEVILNRVRSKHYPNSICEVVYQGSERRTGCQFSFTCDGSMNVMPSGKPWERSKDIASLSLNGFAPKLTDNATHYHTTSVDPVWAATLKYDGQIGSHKFYRFKWRERPVKHSVSMSVAPPI